MLQQQEQGQKPAGAVLGAGQQAVLWSIVTNLSLALGGAVRNAGFATESIEDTVARAYLRRAPISTSSRKPARTGRPPSREAATIMPLDSRPRSLRGARLATMTTLRPIRDSGV